MSVKANNHCCYFISWFSQWN